LAEKALSIDKSDSFSHATLGTIYVTMRQHEKAIARGERSVELDPNGALMHCLLGRTLSYSGRPEEAIVYLRRAIRLNPFPPYFYFYHLGRCYIMKGKYSDALEEFEKALQLAPDNFVSRIGMIITYSLLGREEEARIAAGELLETTPSFSVEHIKRRSPYKNPIDIERIVDALQRAGLK
jgi:tetratricopeptide (TPR) repeat protein